MGYIFISYSRKDEKAVDRLVDVFEKRYFVWIDRDPESIPGGSLWRRAIVEAIENADTFLLVLSPQAVKSEHVRKELDIAEDLKIPIIPIEIQRTTIPKEMKYSLSGSQRIDLATNWDDGVNRVLHALQKGGKAKTKDLMIDEEGQKKPQSILANSTLPVEERIMSYTRAVQAEVNKGRERLLERFAEFDKKEKMLDGEFDKNRNLISSLIQEKEELIKKNLTPQSYAIQLINRKMEELERECDRLKRDREELKKERAAANDEFMKYLEAISQSASDYAQKSYDDAIRLAKEVFGKKE